ncbi:MAG: iron ABC transporter permease [Bdellovibrionota bacterium]
MTSKRFLWVLAALVSIALCLGFGAEPLQWDKLFTQGTATYRILWELRLPRLLFVVLVGGSLAQLGGTYQILFRNPLAEPYILGISSAVVLGVVAGEALLGVPVLSFTSILLGFFCAAASTLLLVLISLHAGTKQVERIVLFGMGLNFVLSSILFLILSFYNQHVGGGSMRWLFGHIPWIAWYEVAWMYGLCFPLLGVLYVLGRPLDAISLGDGVARTLGFSPNTQRTWILVLTSILLCGLVTYTGAIGFVGLVVPHAVRLALRPSTSRTLFVFSFFLGAAFLALSDSFSRVLMPPFELPIGIVTTLIGGPAFLFLLWRRAQ